MNRNKRKGLHLKYNIYALGLMAALISFLGFVVENVWLAVTKGYINNRNMNAPFLLGYGTLVIAMYLLLGTPDRMTVSPAMKKTAGRNRKYAMYFLCALLVVCVGEIMLGSVVEALCGIEYWNYSKIPFHITKYTSIPTSAAFASMITLFMGKCFEPIMELIIRIDYKVLKVVSTVLVVIMLADFIASFSIMLRQKNFYLKWKLVLRK